MPDQRSALAVVYRTGRIGAPTGSAGVSLRERTGRTLVQVSGWPGAFEPACRKLEALVGLRMPERGAIAASKGSTSAFRVGPERLWLAGAADDVVLRRVDAAALAPDAVVTDIGHSRTVVRVAGPAAPELLNRGVPVDLDRAVLPLDGVVQSVVHLVPVLVHRAAHGSGDAYDVYVTCEYAVSFWEWLTEAAQSFGCEVGKPE